MKKLIILLCVVPAFAISQPKLEWAWTWPTAKDTIAVKLHGKPPAVTNDTTMIKMVQEYSGKLQVAEALLTEALSCIDANGNVTNRTKLFDIILYRQKNQPK